MTTTVVPPQAYTKSDLSKAVEWMTRQPAEIQAMAQSADTLMGLYRKALLYGASSITPPTSNSTSEFKSELKELAGQMDSFEGGQVQPQVTEKPKYSSSVSYQASKGLPPWAESSKTDTLFSNQKQMDPQARIQGTEQRIPENLNNSYETPKANDFANPYLNQNQQVQPNPQAHHAPVQQSYSYQEPQKQPPVEAPVQRKMPEVAVNYQGGEPQLSVNYQAHRQTQELPEFPQMPKPLNLPDISAFGNQVEIDTNSRAMLQEVRRKLNLSSDQEALRMVISLGYEKFKKIWS